MNRSERITVALSLLGNLNDKPQHIQVLVHKMNKSRAHLWYLVKKLHTARILLINRGPNGGIYINPNSKHTEDDVIKALGYQPKPRKKTCVLCGIQYDYIHSHTDITKPIFIDEQGRKWVGKKCPDCVDEIAKEKEAYANSAKRKCTDCKQPLPPTRYFKCLSCQPVLPSVDDDAIFYGETDAVGGDDCEPESLYMTSYKETVMWGDHGSSEDQEAE